MLNIFAIIGSVLVTPIFGLSALFFMPVNNASGPDPSIKDGGVAVIIGEPNPPICEACKIVIKNTVWEITFEKPTGWSIDSGNNEVVEVFSESGNQYYFVETFPSRLAFSLEDGRRVFFDFDAQVRQEEGDSSSEFKAVGWEGTLVRNMSNSGFDILYIQLPDKKYEVSVKGVSGQYFDDFLKTVKLQK